MRDRPLLRGALVAQAWLWVAVALVPPVVWRDRLPERLAVHWGIDGQPNGSMPWLANLVVVGALTVAPAVVATLALRQWRTRAGVLAPTLALTTFLGVLGAGVSATIVAANLDAWAQDAPDWTAADDVGGLLVLALVGVSVGAALVVGWMASRLAPATPLGVPAGGPPASPVADLGPYTVDGRVRWEGTARAWWPWMLIVGLGGLGLVLLASEVAWVGALLLVVSLVGLAFVSVHVVVSDDGLRVELGPVGWPAVSFGLDEVVAARHEPDLRPTSWGGWGYRGSVRLLRQAAVVLRAGDAVVVDLPGGRRFAVTVDDAATGAGVLQALVDRRGRVGERP